MPCVTRGWRQSFARRVLLLLIPLVVLGCDGPASLDDGPFRIAGRLSLDVEHCPIVVTDEGVYNVGSWRDPAPFGSEVVLVVRRMSGYASWCSGEIVDVLLVESVTQDFRSDPIVGAETWGPDQGPIVLGRVDVAPEGSLTVLPGTTVRIIAEGWLRVRGTIFIDGTEADSVRIANADSTYAYRAAPLILEGSSPESRVRYLSASRVEIRNADARIDDCSLLSLGATDGSVAIARSTVGSLFAHRTQLHVTESTIPDLGTVYADLVLEGNRLQSLSLSYSRASVRHCAFVESSGYVLFHGESGGAFELNNFHSPTLIEVRHRSRPVFRQNNFLSSSLLVRCESYELPDCVLMTDNWWGTNSESAIRAKFAANTPVCYSPWSSGPIP